MLNTIIEASRPGEFILVEKHRRASRNNVLIGNNQTIVSGQVLGAATIVSSETSTIIVGSNVGNGSAVLANPATSQTAVNGDYLLTCTLEQQDAGKFSVQTPDGREIGPLTVGMLFDKEIKVEIADSTIDFKIGDSFVVRIGIETPADMLFGALDPTAANGMQNAVAIAIYPVTTSNGSTCLTTAIVEGAEVNAKQIVWPAGITAPQQAEAIEQLRRLEVIVR